MPLVVDQPGFAEEECGDEAVSLSHFQGKAEPADRLAATSYPRETLGWRRPSWPTGIYGQVRLPLAEAGRREVCSVLQLVPGRNRTPRLRSRCVSLLIPSLLGVKMVQDPKQARRRSKRLWRYRLPKHDSVCERLRALGRLPNDSSHRADWDDCSHGRVAVS